MNEIISRKLLMRDQYRIVEQFVRYSIGDLHFRIFRMCLCLILDKVKWDMGFLKNGAEFIFGEHN